jgi:hypothetical protein
MLNFKKKQHEEPNSVKQLCREKKSRKKMLCWKPVKKKMCNGKLIDSERTAIVADVLLMILSVS